MCNIDRNQVNSMDCTSNQTFIKLNLEPIGVTTNIIPEWKGIYIYIYMLQQSRNNKCYNKF